MIDQEDGHLEDGHPQDGHPHVFPEGRKPGEILFASVTMVIALVLLASIGWQTTWIPGKGIAAQPRLWPALSLAGMILFGILNAASRSRVTRTPGRWREAAVWLRALEFIGWYMIYVLAIPLFGYLPSTVVFCTALALRLGYRGRTVGIAALFGLCVVLFFKTAMNVKIPGGAIYQFAPEGLRYILLRFF